MRTETFEVPDDITDGELESLRSVCRSKRWTAIRIPNGVTREQVGSFMQEAHDVLKGMALLGAATLEDAGQTAVDTNARAARHIRGGGLKVHRCDAFCHHVSGVKNTEAHHANS